MIENFANSKWESTFFQKKLTPTWLCISLLHLTQEFSLFFIGEYTNNVFHHSSVVLCAITFHFCHCLFRSLLLSWGHLTQLQLVPFLASTSPFFFLVTCKNRLFEGKIKRVFLASAEMRQRCWLVSPWNLCCYSCLLDWCQWYPLVRHLIAL